MKRLAQQMALAAIWLLSAAVSLSNGASPVASDAQIPGPRMYCVIGEHGANSQLVDWLTGEQWVWGVEVWPSTPSDALAKLRQQDWRIIIDWYAHPETRARQAKVLNNKIPDPASEMDRVLKAAGPETIWQALLEDDSAGVGFPQQLLRAKPKTHEQAHALFDSYLQTAMSTTAGWPTVPKWGVVGYATSTHAAAAHGLRCVLVERTNDDVEDLQTAVAFARGAARQYGIDWGIDLSAWWGAIFGCVHELPASLFKRYLYISYFSGARTFRIEGGDLLYSSYGRNGRACSLNQTIADFARTVGKLDPGPADVPVAVMLPEDHGWMTPPYWRTGNHAWSYAKVPYRPGDRGIDGFFGAAFPGSIYAMDPFPFGRYKSDDPPASPFALSCVTTQFAPAAEDAYRVPPPIPFGSFRDRNEARSTLRGEGTDPSPYRAMSDSRWGDIFDVLTDRVGDSVLSAYPVVVVLGPVSVTDALLNRLRLYVERGGTLVWSVGAVEPKHAGMIGARLRPELAIGRAWKWVQEAFVSEAFRYVPCDGSPDADTSVLCRAQSGAPLVLRKPLGKGSVLTCLVPWYEGGHEALAGVALRLLDSVFKSHQQVEVTGLPVEWVSARGPGGCYVVVANHDGGPWHGELRVRGVDPGWTQCHELLTNKPLAFQSANGTAVLRLEVPAYDVRVLRWENEPRGLR